MEELSLAINFSDSLAENTVDCIGELAEVGLDSILEDGLLADVPIISTAISVYKIGSSIKERHNLKKLVIFLNEINKGILDSQKRCEYRLKFQSNEKFRNQEIEFLLVLIDRYISYDKPQMLAKLYLAYLDGVIVWGEFSVYAEVIERLLSVDVTTFLSYDKYYVSYQNVGLEPILRLVALGLLVEETNGSLFEDNGRGGFAVTTASMKRMACKERKYIKTEFGNKLFEILR